MVLAGALRAPWISKIANGGKGLWVGWRWWIMGRVGDKSSSSSRTCSPPASSATGAIGASNVRPIAPVCLHLGRLTVTISQENET